MLRLKVGEVKRLLAKLPNSEALNRAVLTSVARWVEVESSLDEKAQARVLTTAILPSTASKFDGDRGAHSEVVSEAAVVDEYSEWSAVQVCARYRAGQLTLFVYRRGPLSFGCWLKEKLMLRDQISTDTAAVNTRH